MNERKQCIMNGGGKESRKMTKVFRIKNSEELGADCRCTAECMNYEWGDWRVCNFFQWFFFVANLMQIRIGIRRKRRDEPSPAKRCFTSSCPPTKMHCQGRWSSTSKLLPGPWVVHPHIIHLPLATRPDMFCLIFIRWQMMRKIGTLMIVSWSHVACVRALAAARSFG